MSKPTRAIGCSLFLALAACGGTQGGSTTPPPPDFTVKASPPVAVTSGTSVQLGASATGGVIWSLHAGDAGTITADGLYTAPAGAAVVTAIATAVQDSTKTASVVVAVIPAALTAPAKVTSGHTFAASLPLQLPAGFSCSWVVEHGTLADGQSTSNVHVLAEETTASNDSLAVIAKVTDGNANSVTSVARPRILLPAPVPAFGSTNTTVRAGGQASGQVTNLTVDATVTWTVTNGTIVDGQGTPLVTFIAGAAGESVLTALLDNGAGDLNSASLHFTVVGPLQPLVITTQLFVLSGVPGASAVADQPVTWSVTGDATVTSGPDDAFLTYTPGAPGLITVTATARNQVGDVASASASVLVGSSGLQLFAGIPGGEGFLDSNAGPARILDPAGVTLDPLTGDLVLADFTTVRRYSNGVLTTFAGSIDHSGPCQGQGTSAQLPLVLTGIAADESGNVYAGGSDGHICRVDPQGKVTLFVTMANGVDGLTYGGGTLSAISGGAASQFDTGGNATGTVDGRGLHGFFPGQEPAVTTSSGDLIAAGLEGPLGAQQAVLQDLTTGAVLIGQPSGGFGACGAGSLLCDPTALALEPPQGNVLIGDSGTRTISRWDGHNLTLAAGTLGVSGHAGGPALQATFGSFAGMTANPGGEVFVLDGGQSLLRKIANSTVSTLSGVPRSTGAASGAGSGAGIPEPISVAVGADGSVFVAELAGAILRISPAGLVTQLASVPRPTHLTAGPNGSVLISCADSVIRSVDSQGQVAVFAGSGVPGFFDGDSADAQFGAFRVSNQSVTDGVFSSAGGALAWDGVDTLYVADPDNQRIRAVRDGQVSTYLNRLNGPDGVYFAGGKLYLFLDRNEVWRVGPGPSFETLDAFDGSIKFGGLAVDAAGIVYLQDSSRHSIFKFVPGTSALSPFAGSTATAALVGGTLPASLGAPVSLAFAPAGAPNAGLLFVADLAENAIAMIRP